MRRIIERVVTVVTTTTWKISWEADPPQADPNAETNDRSLSSPNATKSAQPGPTVIEMKEADLQETKTTNPRAKQPPDNS